MDGQMLSISDATASVSVCETDFFRETLRRLPLADAVVHLLRFALDESFLNSCYESHRGRGYEDILTFPRLLEILTDVLLVQQGSARLALAKADENETLTVCKEAFYGKLRRLPLDLSVAFMTDASRRLNDLLPPAVNPLPISLHGYQVRIIDGKKIKHIAKRLKLTRTQPGKLFGSKLLAAYDPATRLIQTIAAHADGEKNDAPLVPRLLANSRAIAAASITATVAAKPVINVADAQFCDLVQITQYGRAGEHFVLRYHPKVGFHPDPAKPARTFVDGKGRTLVEEYGWLGSPDDKRRRYVRRITWKRTATHKDMTIVTDLTNRSPDQTARVPEPIPASDLIDLYLTRWTIETVFQDVTTVFGLKKLIGTTPEATAFQAAFCMVVYNAILVVKSYVAAVQPAPMSVDDVSTKMLFESIHKQMTAIAELVPAANLTALVTPMPSIETTRSYLEQRLRGVWEPLWKKARNKTKRTYGPKPKGYGAHTSVYRVLEEHKKKPPAGEGAG